MGSSAQCRSSRTSTSGCTFASIAQEERCRPRRRTGTAPPRRRRRLEARAPKTGYAVSRTSETMQFPTRLAPEPSCDRTSSSTLES